ncbi:MAG: YggS family pyridoxal phosphate-dependent enzyme [Christensenellales bacterium]
MSIRENVEDVLERMEKASARAGRKKEETILIAATKYANADEINELIRYNVSHLGENRVQALMEKYPLVPRENVTWHFIGALQTNKIKYVVDKVSLLHSLDRRPLLYALQQQYQKAQIVLPVLVQVNISRETSKGGIKEEELQQFMEECRQCPHIAVSGLMTMAPLADEPAARMCFRRLRYWFEKLNQESYHLAHLSMGMTNDFEIAIEEGATMIRVGSAIFKNK